MATNLTPAAGDTLEVTLAKILGRMNAGLGFGDPATLPVSTTVVAGITRYATPADIANASPSAVAALTPASLGTGYGITVDAAGTVLTVGESGKDTVVTGASVSLNVPLLGLYDAEPVTQPVVTWIGGNVAADIRTDLNALRAALQLVGAIA